MGHLLGAVTQDKLDKQRGVVQNEKRQGDNQPYGLCAMPKPTGCFRSATPIATPPSARWAIWMRRA
jgi:hypothetical protein